MFNIFDELRMKRNEELQNIEDEDIFDKVKKFEFNEFVSENVTDIIKSITGFEIEHFITLDEICKAFLPELGEIEEDTGIEKSILSFSVVSLQE